MAEFITRGPSIAPISGRSGPVAAFAWATRRRPVIIIVVKLRIRVARRRTRWLLCSNHLQRRGGDGECHDAA